MIRSCPVCGHTEKNVIIGFLPSNLPEIVAHFTLAACIRCDVMYISPLPTEQMFRDMYETRDQFTGPAYQGDRPNSAVNYYAQCLDRIIHHLGLGIESLRLLDVGAGLSFVAKAAKSLSNQVWTVAQDVSRNSVDATRQYVDRYCVGPISECQPTLTSLGPYHIITLTHVIEHLPDPKEVLQDLVGLLAQPGLIYITTPLRPLNWHDNSSISRWRLWSYNHTPQHLQYFGRSSLSRLADAVGCQIVLFHDFHEDGQALEAWLEPIRRD